MPSFARQTGLACNACHTVAPQLNAFGRFFKLHGYVLGSDKLSGGTSQLSIDKFPPLSAMLIISDSRTSKAQPDSAVAGAAAQNGSVAFPQQLSVFYAGAVAEHMGAFTQITYEQPADHFSIDNTDIRYARDVNWGDHSLVWGVTLNNNPTVQDVWNSTPAWGFPFISSEVAPGRPRRRCSAGALAQNVAGMGAYGWLDNTWYGEVTYYRSSQPGLGQPYDSTASGVICGLGALHTTRLGTRLGRWRRAERPGSGLHRDERAPIPRRRHRARGPTDDYRDTGIDAQYQYVTSTDSFALHGDYIHEQQDLNASSKLGLTAPSDHLNYWNLNASYYWDGAYGPTLGYFNTMGNSDPILYAPAPLNGSASGSPNSSGWIAQWTWLPAMNMQVTAQYILYNKFNGASSNYDGSGRNASDNNTLYVALWVLW